MRMGWGSATFRAQTRGEGRAAHLIAHCCMDIRNAFGVIIRCHHSAPGWVGGSAHVFRECFRSVGVCSSACIRAVRVGPPQEASVFPADTDLLLLASSFLLGNWYRSDPRPRARPRGEEVPRERARVTGAAADAEALVLTLGPFPQTADRPPACVAAARWGQVAGAWGALPRQSERAAAAAAAIPPPPPSGRLRP